MFAPKVYEVKFNVTNRLFQLIVENDENGKNYLVLGQLHNQHYNPIVRTLVSSISDQPERIHATARCMFSHIYGYEGTNSDVQDIADLIQTMVN
jgi:hypothetical protein